MSEQDSDTKVELQKVCKELDEVLVSFMAAMELYQARHAKAVGNIKTGYLGLTKARLNAGGISMKADLTLQPNSAVSCDFMPGLNKEVESEGRYSHRRVAYTPNTTTEDQREASPSTPTRRRVAHEDVRDDSSPSTSIQRELEPTIDDEVSKPDKMPETRTIGKVTDPLSAFGFMARNALKPPQTQFNAALSHILDAADSVQEMLQLERRYMELLKRKKVLTSKSS